MRWFLGGLAALVVLIVVYVGSAVYSLGQLAMVARAGDGAAVIARTDVKALNQSLTQQILHAYLDRIGAVRKVSPLERMVVNTYGATVADAMVAKFLTPDRLTEILKSGRIEGTDQTAAIPGMPALGDLDVDHLADTISRIGLIQPTLLSFRVSPTADRDSYAAVHLHFDGSGWKLAGIDLPNAIVRQLAASLPVR